MDQRAAEKIVAVLDGFQDALHRENLPEDVRHAIGHANEKFLELLRDGVPRNEAIRQAEVGAVLEIMADAENDNQK